MIWKYGPCSTAIPANPVITRHVAAISWSLTTTLTKVNDNSLDVLQFFHGWDKPGIVATFE